LERIAPGCGGAPLAGASCGAGRRTSARSASSGSEGRTLPRMVRLDRSYGTLLEGDGYRGSVGGRKPRHLRLRGWSTGKPPHPSPSSTDGCAEACELSVSHWGYEEGCDAPPSSVDMKSDLAPRMPTFDQGVRFSDVLKRENERPPALPTRSRLVRWIATWRSATGGHCEARRVAGRRYIMIDSQGLGAVSRTLRGGVSESVIRHLHCPVFMVCGDGST
jgi:hypothetical protein